MKYFTMQLVLGIVVIAQAFPSLAEWNTHAGMASEYYFRGLSYNQQPSIATLVSQYQHDSGFFGGIWLGRHNDDQTFRGNREIDLWAGYSAALSPQWVSEITVARYIYPADELIDYDWGEVSVALHWQQSLSFSLAVNRDVFGESDEGRVLEIIYRKPLGEFLADASLGLANHSGLEHPLLSEQNINSRYSFYEFGISKSFNKIRSRLAWLGSSQAGKQVYGQRFADGDVTFSINYSF